MTLTQLSYIVAVDTYRHFARAAEQCYVSQPTLSMQIQKLEDELEIIIFDRTKQPIVPTEIGAQIIEQARVILKESSRVQEIIDVYSNRIGGVFRIGIIPTVAPYLVPLFLKPFIKRYPDVNLIVDEIQTDVIVDRLNKDTMDIGILATPLNAHGIIEKPVFYEEFYAFLPAKHELLSKEELSPADIPIKELMLLDEGNCFREQTIQLCSQFQERTRDEKKMHFEGGNLETLRKLVNKNFGITVIPHLMFEDMTDEEKARCRPFIQPSPKREISVIYGRSFLKKHMIKAITSEIKSAVPKEMTKKSEDSRVLTF